LSAAAGACLTALAGAGPAAAELERWSGAAKPGFVLDALDAPRASLDAHVGDVVVVHFFATWCAPCVEEMAALERLAARRRDEPFGILAVDVGEVDARVRGFLAERPVSFPVLLDRDRRVTRAWGVWALPTSFVVDAAGDVALFAERDVPWDDPAVQLALDDLIESSPGVAPAQQRR
jgi:thiol-disulfide isomerase/thioredoxin